MIYAAEWFVEDINYMIGSNLPMILEIYCNDAAYNMTGTQIDIFVRDKTGNTVQTLSTAGGTPEITINNSELTISPDSFADAGKFHFYMKQTSGTTITPIGKGTWIISRE